MNVKAYLKIKVIDEMVNALIIGVIVVGVLSLIF